MMLRCNRCGRILQQAAITVQSRAFSPGVVAYGPVCAAKMGYYAIGKRTTRLFTIQPTRRRRVVPGQADWIEAAGVTA